MVIDEAALLSDLQAGPPASFSRRPVGNLVHAPDSGLGLTEEAAEKVARLAARLLAPISATGPCTLAFGEVGFRTGGSALWLTVAAAKVLAASLQEPVHVLSAGGSHNQESARLDKSSDDRCVLEYLKPFREPHLQSALTLQHRLKELAALRRKVLLHLPDVQARINPVEGLGVQGIVLLARAGHTRKAMLTALQLRFEQMAIPLLGAVLLERTYPIPKALYRLL